MREALVVGALCAAWYATSSASNVVGKLVLTEFPFPMTVTLAQLAAVAALTPPALALARVRRAPPQPPAFLWRTLLPLAAAKVAVTLCSQVSLARVSVSYAHTVKATTPLWTAALARAVWGERQPAGVGAALLLIAGGVGVASATELRLEAGGLAAALAAAALLAAQQLCSKRVLRRTQLHHLRLLQALAAPALALALPAWLALEARALRAAPAPGARALWLLGADGALAWLQALLAFSVLARVSPLTYAVASAVKRAAVVAAALLVLRHPASPLNVAGMALAALGVLAYNRARLARAEPAPRPLLPV